MQEGEFPDGGNVGVEVVRGQIKWFNAVKGFGFVKPDDGSGDVFLHLTCLRDFGKDSVAEGATIECEVAQRAKGKQAVRILNLDMSTAQEGEMPSRAAMGAGIDGHRGSVGPWNGGGRPRRSSASFDGVAMPGAEQPDLGMSARGRSREFNREPGRDAGFGGRPARRPVEVVPEGDFLAATVKWFNPIRGYGFVLCPDYPQDVFLHMEVLRRAGMRDLQPGQDIEIRVGQGPKGLQVAEVRVAS